MAGRGRGRKKSQQKKSTKRNSAPVEEQHVEELSTENDSDDLSAHGIESDNQGTDNQSASSQVIESVLVPTVDEEPLMARLMDGEPDYENEEGFPQKKDKRKVHEEASSSNTSLEDVEKMNKRLGKIERCQVVLKKRCKRMKAMEKKLEKIEDCQYYLKKKAKKRNDSNGADATTKEPEDADMVENTEVVEESEEESEEEAQKESDEVEMNEANEIEEEVETEARVEVETEARVEVETEARVEAETEARVEAETEKTPTPPRGRTKAAAARRQILTTPEKLFGKAEKMVEEEVKEPEEEGEKMVEEEVEEPEEEETEKYTEEEKQEWYMVVYEGSTCETKEADKGAAKPSGSGVKHRPKQMALRKHATKQAPKPRGRPRKDTEPKKFTN
uniref:Uncharacterized protein n=1 Tax=Brassica campestris TaxID=3711 RepID=A0A3P6AQ42_BRACM|nr:unnamed protein product [Brassica rapa]